ncbi:MAG TPA: hypothetical protein VKG45_03760 [Actinomycetes bacterium]|nr:hypothetical protein [Actinomycetes bacterium]
MSAQQRRRLARLLAVAVDVLGALLALLRRPGARRKRPPKEG